MNELIYWLKVIMIINCKGEFFIKNIGFEYNFTRNQVLSNLS